MSTHTAPVFRLLVALVILSTLANAPLEAREPSGQAETGASEDDALMVVVSRPKPAQDREVVLPGSFEPYEKVLLHAKVTGYVSVVKVDIGNRVKRGAPLVHLDIPEMAAELARAEAELSAAKAALGKAVAEAELAEITYSRLSELQAREPLAVIEQNVDVARAEEHVAKSRVETADAEVAVAKAKIDHLKALMSYSVIRAPFDGVVAQRFVHPGTLVVSGSDGGDPVLEVVRVDRLRVVLAVPEAVVPHTRVGLEAEITVDALPGRTFRGVISRFSGLLAQDTRSMRAEIDMEDEGGVLRPGMYATVRLRLEDAAEALSVPASLVHRESGRAFVWTVRNGVAEKTSVEVLRDDGDQAVIEAGLEPDSLVMVTALRDLREGQPVRIQEKEVPR